ncbi:RNA polymerase factor sigma-54 [Salinispira pacifica]|nr:RNA polymerase factor sigma-54 [Salinispira pacifica]
MQYQRPALVQTQKLKLSPQMLQSIQIMALPLQDLKARIDQELDENPALEVLEDRETISLDSMPEKNSEVESYFENSSDPGFSSSYDQAAADSKQSFMENALSKPESLREHLIWQLRLQPIPEEFFQIGELLIRNLDENGFHLEDPELLVSQDQHPAMKEMISIIQRFDPPGCCSADYIESLKIQASLVVDVPEAIYPLIEKHLQALDRGKYRDIARAEKIPEEEVLHCLEILKSLTPFPGREYSSAEPTYVIPDVAVTRENGEFRIMVNEEEIPVLGLNSFFDQVFQESGNNDQPGHAEAKSFVTSKIRDARWFINSIQQRHDTLKKVALAIVEYQRDFFIHGPKSIVPLTLKNVAEDIGVHEATVSRLTRGKYMQTDFGIFELKYFFTNAVTGTRKGGGSYGKEAVKAIMKEILEAEADRHLSDQKISDLLEKRGIKIARRTVAKYRKELDISSSYNR